MTFATEDVVAQEQQEREISDAEYNNINLYNPFEI